MASDEKVVERIEDDAPFEVPEFDEKEFIRKELISFRTTLVLFIFSILVAGITFFAWKMTTPHLRFPILVLLALAIGAALLRFLFKASRIDISHWKRREWAGTMFLYFFFWLGFTLLFVNPPFTDAAAPKIEVAAVPGAQGVGGSIELGAYVADNTGLGDAPVFCVHSYAGDAVPPYDNLTEAERTACRQDWQRDADRPFWSHNVTYPAGRYVAYVIATDENGQDATERTTFEVSSPFVGNVSLPRENKFVVPDDAITVRVQPQIVARTVQFSLDGGDWHNMVPHTDPAKRAQNYWRTDATHEGWKAGTFNVTLRVLVQPTYLREPGNVLKGIAIDPKVYRVTVDPALPEIGTQQLPDPREFPYFNAARTPGPEGILVLGAGLVGLALARRRRAE